MKKIGICTLHDANPNFGATLQAFALQEVLKKMGYEPEFIRFKPEKAKRVRKVNKLNVSKDDVLIDKRIFCDILAKFDKRQLSIILHLLNNVGQDNLILTTQKAIAENLNVSISIINKTIKELNRLKIIEKVKNGKYLLLI